MDSEEGAIPRQDIKRKLDVLKFRSQSEEKNEVPSEDLKPFNYNIIFRKNIKDLSQGREVFMFKINENDSICVVVFADMTTYVLNYTSFNVLTELILCKKKEEAEKIYEQSKISMCICFYESFIALAFGNSLKIFLVDSRNNSIPKTLPIKKMSLPSPIYAVLMKRFYPSENKLPSLFLGTGSGSVHGFVLSVEGKSLKVKRLLLIQPFGKPVTCVMTYDERTILAFSSLGEFVYCNGLINVYKKLDVPFKIDEKTTIVRLDAPLYLEKDILEGKSESQSIDFLMYNMEEQGVMRFRIFRICSSPKSTRAELSSSTQKEETSIGVIDVKEASDICCDAPKKEEESVDLCTDTILDIIAYMDDPSSPLPSPRSKNEKIIAANVMYLNTLLKEEDMTSKSVQTIPFIVAFTKYGQIKIIPINNDGLVSSGTKPLYSEKLEDVTSIQTLEGDGSFVTLTRAMDITIYGPKGILSLK